MKELWEKVKAWVSAKWVENRAVIIAFGLGIVAAFILVALWR